MRPWLTMCQHLLLDMLGGAALVLAEAMMRRQPVAQRALLVAAGVSELAMVALGDTNRGGHLVSAEPVTYRRSQRRPDFSTFVRSVSS
jgi:hypothetical protein